MNHSLDGKKIIITGGTSGIGQATALMAAEAGADIAFCGLSEEGAEKTIQGGFAFQSTATPYVKK